MDSQTTGARWLSLLSLTTAFSLLSCGGIDPSEDIAAVAQPLTTEMTAAYAGSPIAIPDNAPAGILSTLRLDTTGKTKGLTAEVHITHTYVGDLRIKLTCPDGTVSVLQDQVGGSGKAIDKTYAVTSCDGRAAGGNYTLAVADLDARDVGSLTSWKITAQVEGGSGVAISGVNNWYIIGNSRTLGQNTIPLKITTPSTVTTASVKIDALAPFALTKVAGGFQADLDISRLSAAQHTLSIFVNGGTVPAAQKVFRRSHPVYVFLTTDWDTSDSPDSALNLQDALHTAHPALKITHFVGPYTFTDTTLSATRKRALVNWLNGERSLYSDEIGLHIHPYCNFVNTLGGIACRTTPTYSTTGPDTTGYTVPLAVYSEAEISAMLKASDSLFVANGLGKPTSFRAGGWTADIDVARALSANGYKADSSANNWARLEEWDGLGTGYLFNWNKMNWNPIGDLSQPYHPSATSTTTPAVPGLEVLEVPDNGSLVDYVSGEEMIAIFNANWNGEAVAAPKSYVIGLHPVNYDSYYHARMQMVLSHVDRFLARSDAGPVFYETLTGTAPVW